MKLYVQRHSTLLNRLEKAMRLVEKDEKGWWDIIRPKIKRKTSSLTSSSITIPAGSDAEAGESEDPENDPETDFEGVWPNTKEPDKDSKAGSRRSKKSDKGQKTPVKWSQKDWDDWRAGKRTFSDDAATKKIVPRTQAEELEQILIALGEGRFGEPGPRKALFDTRQRLATNPAPGYVHRLAVATAFWLSANGTRNNPGHQRWTGTQSH